MQQQFPKFKRKPPIDSPFWDTGSVEREIWAKKLQSTPPSASPDSSHIVPEFRCSIAGCKSRFTDTTAWDSHCLSCHRHVCSVCGVVLPSSRFLEVHILEFHDSMFRAQVHAGMRVFECVVEGCEKKFVGPCQRQLHLRDKHKFPEKFDVHGYGNTRWRRTQLRKQAPVHRRDRAEPAQDAEVDSLAEGVSRIRFSYSVPENFALSARKKNPFCHGRK